MRTKYLRLGKHMQTALLFANSYPGWHSFYSLVRSTRDPIKRLVKRGLIEVNEFNQFRSIRKGV